MASTPIPRTQSSRRLTPGPPTPTHNTETNQHGGANMARKFGQINSQTWTDTDFKQDLGVDAQWLYFVLISQSNLNGAGVVPLQDRKWRKYARDMNGGRIEAALEELRSYWYVLVDEETEEVLIRTFIRNDGLWKQPNVLLGALRSAEGVMSDTLRAVIWDELQRIPFDKLSKERAGKARDMVAEHREALHGTLPEGFRNPPANPSGSPSELLERLQRAQNAPDLTPENTEKQFKGSQLPFDETLPEGFPEGFPKGSRTHPEASGVGAGVGEGSGESLVKEEIPKTASSGAASQTENAGTLVAEWLDHCAKRPPGQVIGQVSKNLKQMLTEGIDYEDVRRGLAAWASKGIHPSTLPSVVNEVMNASNVTPIRANSRGGAFDPNILTPETARKAMTEGINI